LAAGDVSALKNLDRFHPGQEEPGAWLAVKGYACPHCRGEDGYVRVFRQELTLNKKTKKFELSEKAWSGFLRTDMNLETAIFEVPAGDETGEGTESANVPDEPAAES
jgi:hypothetical protein